MLVAELDLAVAVDLAELMCLAGVVAASHPEVVVLVVWARRVVPVQVFVIVELDLPELG